MIVLAGIAVMFCSWGKVFGPEHHDVAILRASVDAFCVVYSFYFDDLEIYGLDKQGNMGLGSVLVMAWIRQNLLK